MRIRARVTARCTCGHDVSVELIVFAGVHGHQMQRRLNATDCAVEVLQFISLKFKRGVHEKPWVSMHLFYPDPSVVSLQGCLRGTSYFFLSI